MKPFRDAPTMTAAPSSRSAGTARSSARLWSTVLPNPIPGSMQMRSCRDAGEHRGFDALAEELVHLRHDVVVARVVLHRLRLAEHVHQHDPGPGRETVSRSRAVADPPRCR